MTLKIRRAVPADLSGISDLFENSRTTEELEWTYIHTDSQGRVNSLVAVSELNEVVGVISFVISRYTANSMVFQGIIPMGWHVRSDHRGLTGIRLMMEAMKLADFGLTIGGTDKAVVSQRAAGLKFRLEARYFYKSLAVLRYVIDSRRIKLSEQGNLLINQLRTKSFFKHIDSQIVVESIEPESLDVSSLKYDGSIFYNNLDSERILWLLNCPLVKSFLLSIKLEGNLIGYAICYLNKTGNKYRGRIVHLSYLGSEIEVWKSALFQIENFLRSQGCTYISAFGTHPATEKILLRAGFAIGKTKIPIYTKDKETSLNEVPPENWYLSFAEADNACREI